MKVSELRKLIKDVPEDTPVLFAGEFNCLRQADVGRVATPADTIACRCRVDDSHVLAVLLAEVDYGHNPLASQGE